MGSNMKKTGGRKSRDTLPLTKEDHKISCFFVLKKHFKKIIIVIKCYYRKEQTSSEEGLLNSCSFARRFIPGKLQKFIKT